MMQLSIAASTRLALFALATSSLTVQAADAADRADRVLSRATDDAMAAEELAGIACDQA